MKKWGIATIGCAALGAVGIVLIVMGIWAMSAYNRLRGEYCGQSETLLTEILRREWGFEGFVSSDWVWGIHETEAAIAAGMDVEMPRAKYYGRRLAEAVRSERVSEATVDRSVLAVLRTKLAYVARPDALTYDQRWTACRAHVELAREVAEKSFVLLKNEGPTLPLDRDGIRSIAVIGKLAAVANLGDHGSSRVSPPYAVTLLEGVQSHLQGVAEVQFADGSDLVRARALAEEAERAQLLALRAHLDPHFLFNTLNAIAEWCRSDGVQAEEAILKLSAMLRRILEGVKAPTWPLSRELGLVHDLLDLHRIRDPERFDVVWRVPDPIPDVSVPPMLLLPLADNAVKHGPRQGHAVGSTLGESQ